MSTIIDRIRREPALISGLVSAVIALAVSFGADLSSEQVGAVMAVVAAALAIVVRQQVTPHVDIVEHADGRNVLAGPANDLVETGTFVRELPHEHDNNLRA